MIETSMGILSKKDFIKKANEGSLPENLTTISLDLTGCTSLTALPKGLKVENLYLRGCNSLTSLPKGIQVGGNLLCNSLKKLPKNLKVGWTLNLSGCTSLKTLPKGLKVEGNLFLQGCTSLTALPSDMKVGWIIYADESFIQNYPFKEIPKILQLPFHEPLKQLLLERLK
jgi:hypothetical protein